MDELEEQTGTASERAKSRWRGEDKGSWYEDIRWQHRGRRQRDPRLVDGLLAELLAGHPKQPAFLLDAPCGTTRLRPAIERHGRFVGLEISADMLERARARKPDGLVRGDVERLPFRDRAFAVVVCCRLLHHLERESELTRVLSELVRVSDGVVAASFWDAGSLEAWRKRVGLARRPRHRVAHSKERIARAVESAGAEIVAWKHTLRYFSQQVWFVARRTR